MENIFMNIVYLNNLNVMSLKNANKVESFLS